MFIFFLSFLFNCLCTNYRNDKYALVWYNANKKYFEERYAEIGLKKEEEDIEDIYVDGLPIIKENPYMYKFYASDYRYIKWLLVVLEFRKRQDLGSILASYIMPKQDRIIFEVGIQPYEVNTRWVFCVCRRRDGYQLLKDREDIKFFCDITEPSNMSDNLILYSESDELYCDLFQNKVLN